MTRAIAGEEVILRGFFPRCLSMQGPDDDDDYDGAAASAASATAAMVRHSCRRRHWADER